MGSAVKSKSLALVLGVVLVLVVAPAPASAHGPIDPPASKYLARVSQLPAGLDAKVVDGDQRMWLKVAPGHTVIVLDYRGAPYLRFSPGGVQVNEASSMYFLNQVPPEIPPTNLGPQTPPRWHQVSGGHAYGWHDGRLHALATTALAPGATFAGIWRIPVTVDGASSAISGGLYHAPDPPIVWFWPMFVALACVLAALRLRRSRLDERVARGLAVVALVAFAVVGAGQQLHGRPNVSVGQLILLALVFAFTAWGLSRIVRRRHGWFMFFIVAAAALWEGASTIGVLFDGFVLIALPAFVARVAVVACLAAGVALLPVIFALAERPERRRPRTRPAGPADAPAAPSQAAPATARAASKPEQSVQAWEPSS